jgi:hypothetical protein
VTAGTRAGHGPQTVELVGRLRVLDVRLTAENGSLHFDAPPGALTDDLLEAMRAQKADLLAWLETQDGPPVEASGPATVGQRRMRAQHLVSASPEGYNVAQRIPLEGPLDPDALGRAFTALARRQSALRTRLTEYGGELVQEIVPAATVPLPLTDVRDLPAPEREQAAEKWLRAQCDAPFDLSAAPFFRAALLRRGAESWTLALVIHHCVVDGWGLGVALRDLAAFYRAALSNPAGGPPEDEEAGLAPLALSFADVGRWQRDLLSGARREELSAHFGRVMADAPVAMELPYDRPRPEQLSGHGAELVLRLPDEVTAAAHALARASGTTVFMVLLSALGRLLCRLAGQSEVVVACNIANRIRREHEELVGLFTNNIALRLGAGADRPFGELVAATGRQFFAGVDHQEYPLGLLVEDREEFRRPGAPRFPQVLVAMQNQAAPELDLPGVTGEVHDVPVDGGKAELTFVLVPDEDGIDLLMNWSPDLFDTASVRGWADDYVTLLRTLLPPA